MDWSWLCEAFQTKTDLKVHVVAARLIVAALLGGAVALIHRLTTRQGSDTASLSATLVLLSLLIAMVTQVVGDNTARAFSLVGALAIVRFRTIVEDIRDTAFVIFAVVVGMAAGAGNLPVALIGLGVGAVVAFAMKARSSAPMEPLPEFTLTIRVGLRQGIEQLFERVFEQYLEKSTLLSTGSARQGAALELTWRVRLRPAVNPVAFVGELNQLEGVQGVDLQRRS